jgi:ABC-type amino acid transport system permease subunit
VKRDAPHAIFNLRLLVILIALGLGIAVELLRSSSGAALTGLADGLWFNRQVDLLLQVGLMLVGALGIHALLPGQDEDEEEHDGRMD